MGLLMDGLVVVIAVLTVSESRSGCVALCSVGCALLHPVGKLNSPPEGGGGIRTFCLNSFFTSHLESLDDSRPELQGGTGGRMGFDVESIARVWPEIALPHRSGQGSLCSSLGCLP